MQHLENVTYVFPEEFGVLKTWLAGHGVNTLTLLTDRQAAFHAQRLAGTRFKFPAKGGSCREVLLKIQHHVVKDSATRWSKQSGKKVAPKRPVKGTYNGVTVFTDGGCSPNPGRGGWGYVFYRDDEEFASNSGGNPETTNNRMELVAIAEALAFIAAQPARFPVGTPIKVYTDSEYALGVSSGSMRAKAHLDLTDRIRALLKALPAVQIKIVRGHSGERGNERADELATRGRALAAPA